MTNETRRAAAWAQKIAALRDLLAAGTKGPWAVASDIDPSEASYAVVDTSSRPVTICHGRTSDENGRLIAAAITALPALLDRLERYETALRSVASVESEWHGVRFGDYAGPCLCPSCRARAALDAKEEE